MLENFFGQHLGFRQVLEVGHRRIAQPEQVKAGLVTFQQIFAGVGTPATIRDGLAPGCFALMPVGWIVARDEIFQMREGTVMRIVP